MGSALVVLAGFGAAGYGFGRVCRRFFRRRRIGFGRLLLARLMLLLLFVAVGGVYGGLLIDEDGELTDVTRPLVTFGVPAVFLLAAVLAYRRDTKTKVLSQQPGPSYVTAQQGQHLGQHGDAWTPPATAGASVHPAAPSLPPPWTPELDVAPPADGPRLPPRA